jgi:hypothetical protein
MATAFANVPYQNASAGVRRREANRDQGIRDIPGAVIASAAALPPSATDTSVVVTGLPAQTAIALNDVNSRRLR